MTTSFVNWPYWNFSLSTTDEVINFKEKRLSAIFWDPFCGFEGTWAILTGLSDDTLTTTVRLVGRRSFGSNVEFLTESFVAAPKSAPYSNWLFLVGEKFFVHHFSGADNIVNFLFLVNQPQQMIKDQTNFIKHEWMKRTITLENDKIWFWNSCGEWKKGGISQGSTNPDDAPPKSCSFCSWVAWICKDLASASPLTLKRSKILVLDLWLVGLLFI